MVSRSGVGVRVATLALCLGFIGCDTVVTSPAPGPSAVGGSPAPGFSSEPQPSGAQAATLGPPGPGVATTVFPLPEPQLAEPLDIGQSLYDPALVPVAVVSLLDAMGVEIVGDDGAVLRPGTDRGAGLLSLTAAEVRGFIEMTWADLEDASGDDLPGPVSVRDLHRGLAPSLPAGYSAEEFAAAYAEAYGSEPQAFAAQVMLGMPIEPETRLMRIQMWLLLIDGFVRPDPATAAGTVMLAAFRPGPSTHSVAAAPTANLGVAAQVQPQLQSPIAGVSNSDWAALLAALPRLPYTVPFVVQGLASVHEGHGGQGPRLDLTARILRPQSIVSVSTGQVLVPAANPGDGVPITWASYDEAVLNDHGRVLGQLNVPMLTDSSGGVRIAYQTKQEDARVRIIELDETGTIYGEVEQRGLVVEGYDLPVELYAAMVDGNLVSGTIRTTNYEFPIEWHEQDVLYVTIENRYDYTFTVGGIAELHRNGSDVASGNLAFNATDQTYRGLMEAASEGHADGTAMLTLGGSAECHDDILSTQTLYVVGEKQGNDFLLLRFYPETPPNGDATICQPNIPFRGGGRYRRPFGAYIPLNDTRWSTPAAGYEIQVPSTYRTLEYMDDAATAPELGICSEFYVAVTRIDPDASSTPQPFPQPAAWQCQ